MMNSLKTNLATHKFISHNFTEEHHQAGLKMTHLGSFQNSDAEEKDVSFQNSDAKEKDA